MFSSSNPPAGPVYPRDPLEKHHDLAAIAEAWGVDWETARRAFIDEEGVLILGDEGRHDGKRPYLTIRIPDSVLHRVYATRTERRFHAPMPRTRTMISKSKSETSHPPFAA